MQTSTMVAAGGAALLGLTTYNNIQKGEEAFNTPMKRVGMHLNNFFLTCCIKEFFKRSTDNDLLVLALSIGGTVLYAGKIFVNIQDDEKRYKTLAGRSFEVLGNMGGSAAIIYLGESFGLTPLSIAQMTCVELYQGAKSLSYHGARLASQIGLSFLFGHLPKDEIPELPSNPPSLLDRLRLFVWDFIKQQWSPSATV